MVEYDVPCLLAEIRRTRKAVDEHRERANAIQAAWDSHKAMDCAIKCAREIEELLGTSDPVEAAKRIRGLLESEVQAAGMRSAIEKARHLLTCHWSSNPNWRSGQEHTWMGQMDMVLEAVLKSDAGKALAERVRALERVAELADRICSIFEIHDYPEVEAVPVLGELDKALAALKEAEKNG